MLVSNNMKLLKKKLIIMIENIPIEKETVEN